MDIKDAALRYLAARARTSAEMKEHLLLRGYDEKNIEEIIDEFKKLKYLDDLQYACDYIHYGISKGRGRIRISQELFRKGIDRFTAEDAFYMIATEGNYQEGNKQPERDRALTAAGKITEGREIDRALLGKVSRRLASLGYDSETINYVLGELRKKEKEL